LGILIKKSYFTIHIIRIVIHLNQL